MVTIEMELPLKLSTNEFYSNRLHWSRRKKIKDDYYVVVKSKLNAMEYKMIEDQVNIEFDYFFKTRMTDVSNTSIMSKMIEDALVTAKLIKDDTPKYVPKITTTVQRTEKDRDWVRITLKKVV